MIENEILIINLADFFYIHVFIVPEIYIRVPWAQTLEILAVNRILTSGSQYNKVGLLFAIDWLIHVLEKVSNFHQGYVSNAYPRLHVVKEQIFISSAKHTPGAYHPKIFC